MKEKSEEMKNFEPDDVAQARARLMRCFSKRSLGGRNRFLLWRWR